jgi:hypothetical protein
VTFTLERRGFTIKWKTGRLERVIFTVYEQFFEKPDGNISTHEEIFNTIPERLPFALALSSRLSRGARAAARIFRRG